MAAKKPTKKATSTGSPTLDAANAAKKFKAPKGYKPLTTAQKVAMAASVLPAGRAAKIADKTVAKLINSKTNKMMHFGGKTTKDAIKQRIKANKVEKSYKEEARALKAANKPTRASKNPDTAAVKRMAEANRALGQKEPYATRNAQERADILNAHFGKAKGYKGNSTPPKKAVIKKKSK